MAREEGDMTLVTGRGKDGVTQLMNDQREQSWVSWRDWMTARCDARYYPRAGPVSGSCSI